MKKYYKYLVGSTAWLLPMLVLAQTFDTLINNIENIINQVIPIFLAIAVLVFIWGVVQFVASAGDEEKRATGRQHMIWGVVGIVVIVGIWGLVNVVVTAFGIQTTGGALKAPEVKF